MPAWHTMTRITKQTPIGKDQRRQTLIQNSTG